MDGEPVSARYPLSWLDGLGRAYPLVWLRNQRQFDVELWVDGVFVGYVPHRAYDVEADYDEAARLSA